MMGMYKKHQWTSIWGETDRILWGKPWKQHVYFGNSFEIQSWKIRTLQTWGVKYQTWSHMSVSENGVYHQIYGNFHRGKLIGLRINGVFIPRNFQVPNQKERVTSAIWGKPSTRKHISIFSMVNLISCWIPPINPFFSIFIHRFPHINGSFQIRWELFRTSTKTWSRAEG